MLLQRDGDKKHKRETLNADALEDLTWPRLHVILYTSDSNAGSRRSLHVLYDTQEQPNATRQLEKEKSTNASDQLLQISIKMDHHSSEINLK